MGPRSERVCRQDDVTEDIPLIPLHAWYRSASNKPWLLPITARVYPADVSNASADSDTYIHGHAPSVLAQHVRRTAEEAAAFLLPRIPAGARLLDVGCGPGSITAGLAQHTEGGSILGIDVVGDVLLGARKLLAERGIRNADLSSASVYRLPVSDATFDVVYAHQVLQHLSRPVEALREMRRVLKPGGLVAVRDADYGTMVHWPKDRRLDRFQEIYHAVARRNEVDADAGRRIPSWLKEAGFEQIEISTSVWTFDDSESTGNWGNSWAVRTLESALATQAIEYGLATQAELEEISCAWRAWARHPDAFFMFIHVEGIGIAI